MNVSQPPSISHPSLQPIHKREEASLDSYILYDLNGGMYAVPTDHYPDFFHFWVRLRQPPALTMDLAFAASHSLILDFDYLQEDPPNTKLLDTISALLKRALLPTFPHFTYIVSIREGSRGVHIHLPEFKIGHDDYILFCKQLQTQFEQLRRDYKLDILANAMLSGAAKPHTSPYRPARLIYTDESVTHSLNIRTWADEVSHLRSHFPKRKFNETSLFRILLNCDFTLLLNEVKQLMMPVTLTSIYTLVYVTSIGKTLTLDTHSEMVAQFMLSTSEEVMAIVKSKTIAPKNTPSLKTYHYLKLNARNITFCQTDNHALKMWYQRFAQSEHLDDSHIPPFSAMCIGFCSMST